MLADVCKYLQGHQKLKDIACLHRNLSSIISSKLKSEGYRVSSNFLQNIAMKRAERKCRQKQLDDKIRRKKKRREKKLDEERRNKKRGAFNESVIQIGKQRKPVIASSSNDSF